MAQYACNLMKITTRAGAVAVLCLLAPGPASGGGPGRAEEAPLFRVFLTDGTTLVSFGEFARVGDRVVFSMPLNADLEPALHLVNIAANRVDWARTNRYAESARATRYLATRAESDYIALSNDLARTLTEVSQVTDASKRLALVESARKQLAEWPRDHYGYRSNEVRQMLSMLDDAIADLRAATGDGHLNLTLSTYMGDPPPAVQPLLPPPTPKEAIEQTLLASRLADSPVERESLLDAAIRELDRSGTSVPADWRAATHAAAQAELASERRLDRVYQTLSTRVMARAEERAKAADVRGLEGMLEAVARRDAALGRQRPDDINALVTAVQAKLDQARQLRLARDRWAMRAMEFEKYRLAITEPIDLFALFARITPALEDIRSLAGSTPGALGATERAIAQIAKRAALIVPPQEFNSAHALIVSAAQLASNAAVIRRQAALSGDMARAWDASSAAAGALMLSARAKGEIQTLLRPPELK
jgi:hypothetical protein